MYCKQCHYPLVGLDRAQCPECGLGFNLSDPTSYHPNPWNPRWEFFQWVRFIAVVATAGVSIFIVWEYGETLLWWHYGQNTGGRLVWSVRRYVDHYDTRFVLAGVFMLSSLIFAVLAMRRSRLPKHVRLTRIARWIAFAAATWWIGWYLAIHYGHLLLPPI